MRRQTQALSPATTAAYRGAGWTITPGGRPDTGQRAGPCAICRQPTVRYGHGGQPRCVTCREVSPDA